MSSLKGKDHGRIISIPQPGACLDTAQLDCLEKAFRESVAHVHGGPMRFSRQRILIIFLLIRYTGAKLREVLALNPARDIDLKKRVVRFGHGATAVSREVQISEILAGEIFEMVSETLSRSTSENLLQLDPGFVRRKFYQQARACGFSKRLGGPEMIRKARAVELMQGNMPLPAVQMMLGHSTPNLTSAYVSFSRDEIQKVAKLFLEKESAHKSSARNSFFGKVQEIRRGDIQTLVHVITIDGFSITTLITNDSVGRLGLRKGMRITAEVKAPWVCLQRSDTEPACSSENRMKGAIEKLSRGKINTECVVRVSKTTELCAVISTAACRSLKLKEGDEIWAHFSCFSVVLHGD